MKTNYLLLSLFGLAALLLNCTDQTSQPEKKWYKGNLHTHSYWSDGDEFPEVIMNYYKSNNYDFVALTEHNILAQSEKWKAIREDSIYQAAFQRYLAEYGEDWVNWREMDGKIEVKLKTYDEYCSLYEEKEKFLILLSEEITDGFEGKPLHMNANNVQGFLEPQHGNSVVDVLQNNIDAVWEQREETGEPVMIHINHPNFYYAITWQEMAALEGERFFEVYNGHSSVHNSGNDEHISTEYMWDLINVAYLEDEKPLMLGLATDDSHSYHQFGNTFANAGRGWVMVQADSLEPRALIEAMEAGNFYSSTGVTLHDVTFENNILSVIVDAEEGVSYTIDFIGVKVGETDPEVLKTVDGTDGSFTLTFDHQFVRAKITSSKLQNNPIEDILYEMAFTQPVTPTGY